MTNEEAIAASVSGAQAMGPSAEALKIAKNLDLLEVVDGGGLVLRKDSAFIVAGALDAFAAQAVAVDRASRQPMSEEDAKRLAYLKQPCTVAGGNMDERNQIDAEAIFSMVSDPQYNALRLRLALDDTNEVKFTMAVARGLTIGLVSMMRAKGALMPGSVGCEQEIDDYFAAALAEARRVERERCAQICDADSSTALPDERRAFLAHGELPTAAWQARRSAAAIRALPDNA